MTGMDVAGQKEAQDTAKLCAEIRDLSQKAVGWLGQENNRNLVGQRHETLLRQMRQTSRQAERLRNAASSPASIAVYGGSQAGKSWLVAHLAAPPGERSAHVLPHAKAGGIPFLEINPTGGKESTGLVTRFTAQMAPGDGQFPVLLRLLTALDLVKILTSCYFVDLDQSKEAELDQQKVEQVLAGIRPANGAPARGLTAEEIYELMEYCGRWSYLRNNIKVLGSCQYWERLAAHVERLDLDELTRVLEVLWGGIASFSAMFRKLFVALQQIGFATELQCGIDALIPRVDKDNNYRPLSILDVGTLNRLLNSGTEPLQVRHAAGVTMLERPVVTALTAEMVLNIHGAVRPFLHQIDLLDFPGARSRGGVAREKLEEGLKKEAGPESVKANEEEIRPEKVFLRGKVARLFERYREDYDLTSMIFCNGPSVQDVTDLPRLINEWVVATHGETPEKRRRMATALFLVLTQFDRLFQRQALDEEASVRWNNRINSSIADFLAKDGNWTREWHPGRPFANTFWYRSPFIEQSHLIHYDRPEAGAPEIKIRPEMVDYVATMRAHYESVEPVRRHFSDPAKAWEAVLTLNDGGITYLADAIGAISSKNLKIEQIRARASSMAQAMQVELKPYFFDSDPNSQMRARKEKAMNLLQEIDECYSRGLFGRLLVELQLEQDEIGQIYRSVRLREGMLVARPAAPVAAAPRVGGPLRRLLGLGQEPAAAEQEAVLDCRSIDDRRAELEERFACRAVTRWVERIDATCQDQELLSHLGLTHEGAQTLAAELAAGIRRTNLAGKVSVAVRDYTKHPALQLDLGASSPALVAATMLSRFVNAPGTSPGGSNGTAAAATIAANGAAARANGNGAAGKAVVEEERDLPVLGEESTAYDLGFCERWMESFIAFVIDNAQSPEGQSFDVEQNAALGSILSSIGAHA